ncbi:hypothetical protein V1523DRAFT_418171 [Lipomyces doorenjongii]
MEALGDCRKVMPEDDNLHLQPPHSPRGRESDTRTVSGRYGYVRSVASAPAVRQSVRLESPNTRLKNAYQGPGNEDDIAGGLARSSVPPTRRRIVRSQLTEIKMGCAEADSNVHGEGERTQELNDDSEPRAHKQKNTACNSTSSQPDSSFSKSPASNTSGIAHSVRQGRRVVPRSSITLINDEPAVIPSSLYLQASDQTKESISPTELQPAAVPTEIAGYKSVQPSCTTRTGRVIKPRNPVLLDVQKTQAKPEQIIPCSTSEMLNNANSKLQLISQRQPEKASSSSTPEPAMPPNPGTVFRELKELFSEEGEDGSPDLSDPDEDIVNDPDMMQSLFPIFGVEPAFEDSSSLAYAFSSNSESRSDSDSADASYSHQWRRESRSRPLSRTPRVVQSQQRKRRLNLYALEVEVDRHPKSLRGHDRTQSNSSSSIESLCYSTRTESKNLRLEADCEEFESYALRNSDTEIKSETEATRAARSGQRLDVHAENTTGDKRADIPRNTSDEDEELPPTQLIDDEAAWLLPSQLIHRVSAHCSSDSVAMATPKMSMLSSIESFGTVPLIQPIQSQSGVLPLLSSNGEHHSAQPTKQLHLSASATNSCDEYKAFLAELDQKFPKTQVELGSLHGRRATKRSVFPTTPPGVHVHDDSFVPDTPVHLLTTKSPGKSTSDIVKAAANSSVVKHASSSYCDTNSDVSEVIDPLPCAQAIQLESIATTQVIESSDINSAANNPLTDTHISPALASVIAAEKMPGSQPAVLSMVESNDSTTRSTMEILDSRPNYSTSATSSNDPRLLASMPTWLSNMEKCGGQEYIAFDDESSETSKLLRPNERNSEINTLSDMYASDEGGKRIASNEDEENANDDGSARRSLRKRRPPTQFSPRPIIPSTARKTRRSDKFSSDYLLNNAKSALVDLPDLSMFISEDAFRRLSIEDRRDIMQYILPIDRASSTSPVPGFFRNVVIQDAARQLQADIGLGRYTKSYAEQYKRATAAIANGETDEYKEGQFELWWGQKARGINV